MTKARKADQFMWGLMAAVLSAAAIIIMQGSGALGALSGQVAGATTSRTEEEMYIDELQETTGDTGLIEIMDLKNDESGE